MINVGDKVTHNFSKVWGIVKDIRNNEYGYNYLVSWVKPDKSVTQGWYQEKVLVKEGK